MTRIKIVPNAEPNSEGEWRDISLDTSVRVKWRHLEYLVKPFIPEGYHVVAVERSNSPLRKVVGNFVRPLHG